MDMIACKKNAKYTGSVYVNGREMSKDGVVQEDGHLYTRAVSYVAQQDLLPQFWTVKEAVLFNLRLKNYFPAGTEKNQMDTADQILTDVSCVRFYVHCHD